MVGQASNSFINKVFPLNYTVTERLLLTENRHWGDVIGTNQYGFDYNVFFSASDRAIETTTSFDGTACRFIGAKENDGNRWSVGDTIDVFVVDEDRLQFKDNNEFELLSASTLEASVTTLFLLISM